MGGPGSGVTTLRTTPRKGRKPLRGVDRRARAVRAFLDRQRAITADLGDSISTLRASLVDRAVFLEARLQHMEQQALSGGALDMELYLAGLSTLVRVADKIGLHRIAKRASLADELQQHGGGG